MYLCFSWLFIITVLLKTYKLSN